MSIVQESSATEVTIRPAETPTSEEGYFTLTNTDFNQKWYVRLDTDKPAEITFQETGASKELIRLNHELDGGTIRLRLDVKEGVDYLQLDIYTGDRKIPITTMINPEVAI